MKKLLPLFLLCYHFAGAQVVNIPDPAFKAELISRGFDTSGDGEIQLSEAQAVQIFGTSNSAITDMTGIEAFTNLTELEVAQVPITALNVSGMTQLTRLHCSDTSVSVLDVANLTGLTYLCCRGTLVSSLDVGQLVNLIFLETTFCSGITSLDVAPLVHLKQLRCNGNNLTSLNLTPLMQMEVLEVSNNPIASIDISNLSLLRILEITATSIASIDLSTAPNLEVFGCAYTPMTSLDVSMVQLHTLFAGHMNSLTSVNFGDQPNLANLNLGGAQLQADLNNLPALLYLTIEGGLVQNEITFNNSLQLYQARIIDTDAVTMDFSHNPNLNTLNIIDCANLNYANVKRGPSPLSCYISGCPNLLNVCADEENIPLVMNNFVNTEFNGNNPNGQVNSYCSFVPGGVYNTISGTVRFDADNNGCDGSDVAMNHIRIGIDDGQTQGAVFTNPLGAYAIYVQQTGITLTPALETPDYFNITPETATVDFTQIDGAWQSRDFCLSANGIHPDVELMIVPLGGARPGFDSYYELIYKNKGNQTVSGQIDFTFDDNVLDFVNSAPDADNLATGNLTYNYSALLPFETRSISITLNANSPMEIPAVNINDVFDFTASIVASITPDETPTDNNAVLSQTVVGSFDPNDKHCLEGATVNPSQIGQYLHYVINFENTGTAAAENVVVKDVIDTAKFDLASFQMLSSSHSAQTSLNGNKVEFVFEAINLGAGEHGHVVFKVKTKSNLTVNSSVSNKADIFFDYNFPITTNTATTTFELLGTREFATDSSIVIYPNPATHTVIVKASNNIQSVELFDATGRLLLVTSGSSVQSQMDVSHYATGSYYLKVKTEQGTRTEKLLKN